MKLSQMLAGVLVLAFTVTAAPRAFADLTRAAANFEKGTRLYQVGEYGKALEEFKAGYVEEADASFLFNIAQCYWRLGQHKEAVLAYRRFLSLTPETPLRADVEHKIAELEEHLRADPAPPRPLAASADAPQTSTASLTTSAPRLEPRSRWPVWLGAVTTVALAGGATALGVMTNRRYDELRTTCGRTPAGCSSVAITDVQNRGRLVNVLAGLAGVAAVATGVAFFVTGEQTGVAVAGNF